MSTHLLKPRCEERLCQVFICSTPWHMLQVVSSLTATSPRCRFCEAVSFCMGIWCSDVCVNRWRFVGGGTSRWRLCKAVAFSNSSAHERCRPAVSFHKAGGSTAIDGCQTLPKHRTINAHISRQYMLTAVCQSTRHRSEQTKRPLSFVHNNVLRRTLDPAGWCRAHKVWWRLWSALWWWWRWTSLSWLLMWLFKW